MASPNASQAWSAYETLGIGIVNFDFGGFTPGEARALVARGLRRWALGGVLRLVPLDYVLGAFEQYVAETAPGQFEVC